MKFLKLKQLFHLFMGVAMLWAALMQGAWAAGEEPQTRHFSYSFYQDETREMGIESIQNASFKPIDYINRQGFSSHVVWLKIEAMGAEKTPKDWSVKFLPSLLLHATVYKPNEFNSSLWESHDYGANALARPLLLGTMPPNTPIYLRLHSDLDFRLNLIVGEIEKIDLIQRRIDMFVIMITTMTLLAFVLAVVRVMLNFTWWSLGIAALSLSIPTAWISAMGMLPFLTGIDQQFFHRLFPIAIMGGAAVNTDILTAPAIVTMVLLALQYCAQPPITRKFLDNRANKKGVTMVEEIVKIAGI
jgi:hypothetical protein